MQRIIAWIGLGILVAAWHCGSALAEAVEQTDNAYCLTCHGKPGLQPATEKCQGRELFISKKNYARSVHRKMACVECHPGEDGQNSFRMVPHTFKEEKNTDCLKCHPSYFKHIADSFQLSHHFKKLGDKISCKDCHNAHDMAAQGSFQTSSADVYPQNMDCIECHTNLVRHKQLSGKEVFTQNLSHSFLPFKEEHFANVRCVECHTPVGNTDIHVILPKDQSLKDCTACHSESSLLVSRMYTPPSNDDIVGAFLGKGFFDDNDIIKKLSALPREIAPLPAASKTDYRGFINHGIFADTYVVGASRNTITDAMVAKTLIIVLFAVLIHGTLRIVTAKKRSNLHLGKMHQEYVYDRSVRWLHWINAALFIVLIPTGFSMHFSGKAGSLPFALSVDLHHYAGLLLIANYLAFALMSIATGNIRSYIPSPKRVIGRTWQQIRFYLYGIFVGEPHPFRATRRNRFNPLQKAAYLPLMYLAMPLLILSGIFMLFPAWTPQSIFGYQGRWLTDTFHYLLAVLFTVFFIAHLYLGTTGHKATAFFKAMISGVQETPRRLREDQS